MLVFDGARNPLKAQTNPSRYKDMHKELKVLEELYLNNVTPHHNANRNEAVDNNTVKLQDIIDEANGNIEGRDGNNNSNNNNNNSTANNNNKEKIIKLKDVLAQQKKRVVFGKIYYSKW